MFGKSHGSGLNRSAPDLAACSGVAVDKRGPNEGWPTASARMVPQTRPRAMTTAFRLRPGINCRYVDAGTGQLVRGILAETQGIHTPARTEVHAAYVVIPVSLQACRRSSVAYYAAPKVRQ